MKVFPELLIFSSFLLLGACAASIDPQEISNGLVGDSSTRIEASSSHRTILFLFSNDQNKNPALARNVNDQLAKQCSGGRLENVTLDLSRKEVWIFAQKETLRGTANCIKPGPKAQN